MKTLLLAALALIFCAHSHVFASQMPYCQETMHEIDIDQSTDIGFAARDLINLSFNKVHQDWSWDYREGSTFLTFFARSVAKKARYVDSVAVYPDGAPDISIICAKRVEIDAWVNFATEDGAFSERWYTTLYDTDGTDCMPETGDPCLEPGTEANFIKPFHLQDLYGSFYEEIAVPDDITVDFYARGRFAQNLAMADVYGHAYSCSENNGIAIPITCTEDIHHEQIMKAVSPLHMHRGFLLCSTLPFFFRRPSLFVYRVARVLRAL